MITKLYNTSIQGSLKLLLDFIYYLRSTDQASLGDRSFPHVGAPTEKISEFVDDHLKPMVIKIQSYVRDATDFLVKSGRLSDLPPGTLLVTMDVKSLYMNITHDEGITACDELLNARNI